MNKINHTRPTSWPPEPWPEPVAKAIRAYQALADQYDATMRTLSDLMARWDGAEIDDRKAYAAALIAGRKDPGEAKMKALQAEMDAERRKAEALEVALNELWPKIATAVDAEREAWAARAEADITAARDAYGEAIEALVAPRAHLADVLGTALWLRDFPRSTAWYPGKNPAIVGIIGRNEDPMNFDQVLAGLREDAHPVLDKHTLKRAAADLRESGNSIDPTMKRAADEGTAA